MKQRQLEGIKNMANEHERLLRNSRNRQLGLYAAILELEYNPHPDPVERERINKLVKKLRRMI